MLTDEDDEHKDSPEEVETVNNSEEDLEDEVDLGAGDRTVVAMEDVVEEGEEP